ncbi:Protein kinase-like domain protein [Ophiocordyceps sinensis CO18]|nr:Protein kinase-like domain protein [Ophiocordyceps sinensis CO18]
MFHHLSNDLPSRFKSHATQLQGILPMLRSGEHPVVLTHGDLNEMNILVDHASGKITGVVDWAEASFQPFGFTLYALDNALGSMGPDGWEYFDNADYLRNEFWSTFSRLVGGLSKPVMESIRLARVAGLLIRYGTNYNKDFRGMIGVRDSSDASLRYLDALLSD